MRTHYISHIYIYLSSGAKTKIKSPLWKTLWQFFFYFICLWLGFFSYRLWWHRRVQRTTKEPVSDGTIGRLCGAQKMQSHTARVKELRWVCTHAGANGTVRVQGGRAARRPYLGCSHILLSAPSHPQCSLQEETGDELIIRIWYRYECMAAVLKAFLFNVRRPTCWVEHSAAHGIKFIDSFSSI